jgi:RNase P subunit RPR2
MDKYFLTPRTNNEIVLNKLNLKKLKTIAKRLGLRNYSQYNSKTKSDLIKLILKEELDAGEWFNKLSRLNIKKLKSIAEKLVIKIKQNSKKTDLVDRISDNVNNENLNTVLKEIGSQSLEELSEETMSKNESTHNTTIKELRKIAKEKNIKGYSKMKKVELLQKINDQPFAFEDSCFTEFSKKPKIKIIETKAEYTKKWGRHKVYYKVILVEDEETSESDLSDIIMKKITTIREGLNEMIKIVKQKTNFKEGDLMNIVVNHPDLWNPISTGLSRTSDIDNLLNKIQSILTSNQDLDIYGCTFYAEVVNMPRGATNAKRLLNIAEDSRTKKSITPIKNKDNLCCPTAVIVGLTYHTNIILGREYDHNDIRYIRMGRNLQTTLAQELHGVPELAYQPLTVYFNICSKRDFATINIQTLVVFKLKPF